ncbi:DUF4190 domain-containing protein [Microbacterium sp. LRZ72]|uniref:DUF4190 domain-containing protein n=1 Tax=Microbacterium sp. LRZ72 TaxID=2942481 RepID=UPI0029B6FB62|nr:DUF4190 domain-containing protein [Microbacterium sp. LRZ72]MDX2375284.1 DUF4190 domain-containing protein [Microbacterium sp. LRZ72]
MSTENPGSSTPQNPTSGGYPPPPPAATGPAAPTTNTLSIVALVAGLVGLFILPFIGSIVAVITGHMSLGQIKRTGEQGRGLALAGTIMGWVGIGLAILGVILVLALLPAFLTMASTSGSMS